MKRSSPYINFANLRFLDNIISNIDWIYNFYLFINFDKKKYETYFRNLIFK